MMSSYSQIPKKEIESRIKKLSERLNHERIYGALLFSVQELYYYSGIGLPGVVYIPADGEAIRLIDRNLELGREYSGISNVRPLGRQSRLFDTLEVPQNTKIAIEADILPYSFVTFLSSRSENRELVDGSSIFRDIRTRKSLYEIDQIRAAAELVDRSFEYLAGILHPDMTEIDVVNKQTTWLLENGHSGYITTHSFNAIMTHYSFVISSDASSLNTYFTPVSGLGLSLKYPFGPSGRKLGRDKPFIVDTCGNKNGYISDTTRTFVCGKLDEPTHQKLEALETLRQEIHAGLTAGTSLSNLYIQIFELADELGVRSNFMGTASDKVPFLGHGVGLELDELPIFYDKGPVLEAGNVIACEPKLIEPGKQVLGIEDTIAVMESGPEILSRARNCIEI